ncbi:MAG TPA: PH domain-containing protein [Gaiellales bacterium]|nr:PH domain-containing protein [Gaiellales bacterium]
MPPLERLLARNEHVHLVTREHEIVLIGPFLRACILLTACSYASVRIAGTGLAVPLRLLAVGILGVLAARTLLRLVRAVGRWQRRTLVVTDRRALLVHGGLSRRVAALPLDAIHDIEIVRARPGWVFHYGGLVVTTGGRRDLMFGLRRLPDPDLLLGLLLGLADDLPEPSPPPRWRLTPGGVPVAAG